VAPPFAARRLRAAVGLPERDGVLVRGVEDDSPAGRAGLRRGDLIVRAGTRDVATVEELYAALDGVAEGDRLTVRVVRGTDELDLDVDFGSA
jgi:serine protease Do